MTQYLEPTFSVLTGGRDPKDCRHGWTNKHNVCTFCGMDDPEYYVDDLEVRIVTEPDHRTRVPRANERAALDAYFASDAARDEDGRVFHLHGEEIDGVDGPVLTYLRG